MAASGGEPGVRFVSVLAVDSVSGKSSATSEFVTIPNPEALAFYRTPI
jgi:hypothetical protein